MDATLYLTPDEITHIFSALPGDVQEAWKGSVEEEGLTEFFESEDDIVAKLTAASEHPTPALKAFIKDSADLTDALPAMDAHVIRDLADAVGAAGMSAVLVAALTAKSLHKDDLDGVAALSEIRHRVLVANSAA